jgi:hypothetical protein
MGLQLENEVAVAKTPTIISNNPVYYHHLNNLHKQRNNILHHWKNIHLHKNVNAAYTCVCGLRACYKTFFDNLYYDLIYSH